MRIETVVEWGAAAGAYALLWAFLVPVANAPALNADSGTALSISLAATRGDFGPLVDGLFPPLQTFVYAGLMMSGLTSLVAAVPALSSLALAMLLGAAMYRYTRSGLFAAFPGLILLFSPVYWEQTGSLTFYAAYALMGYAGLALGAAYLFREDNDLRLLGAGALFLGGSLYAFTTALQFLPVPGLLLLFYWSRPRFNRTLAFYVATSLVALPWFVWHILVGGTHFYYHPLNWIAGEHLAVINSEFWGYPHESFSEYVPAILEVGFEGLLVMPMWFLVPLGIIEIGRRFGLRAALFVIAVSIFFLATIFAVRPAPFARYFYSILPLCVFLAAIGGYSLVSAGPKAMQRIAPAGLALGCLLMLLVLKPGPVLELHKTRVEALDESPSFAEMQLIAQVIDDDRAIIGRDSRMQFLLPDNVMKTFFLVSEPDYVTYLSWPSEREVLRMLDDNDIGWVLLYKDAERWERDYHVWLDAAYGKEPRHYREIPASASFELAFSGRVFELFKVVPSSVNADLAQ